MYFRFYKIMGKKEYIAPVVEIAELEVTEMLSSSLNVGISDEITEDDAVMSNRHRGQWGDRWSE